MKKSIIKIENISKVYNLYKDPLDRLKEALHPFRKKYHQKYFALKDVTFDVKKGETVGIVGRNGCGKSTLLKIITGVLTPTSGSAIIDGKVLALLELGSGFNPEISGFENVYFNGALMGATRDEIDSKIDLILGFADIGDFIYQPVKTYSSGMYVRLAFAVIANMEADILVIDEALSVGDAFFTQKCMRFLRTFKENGTVLFVSHDTSAVTNLCHRAVWLENGSIRKIGKAKDISEGYLEAYYEEKQGSQKKYEVLRAIPVDADIPHVFRDQRQDLINNSILRNDLEIFRFDAEASSFGNRGGKIIDTVLTDQKNNPLLWAVGGEGVILKVKAVANKPINNPIIGFIVKDKLGQNLFGDNTYISQIGKQLLIEENQYFQACFKFIMPIMPPGDYSICVALAEGTQENHMQHQWIHDALMFKSHSSSVSTGIIGIPMEAVSIDKIEW
jgi:lipopolysaccharide transport system ATP-binding protein